MSIFFDKEMRSASKKEAIAQSNGFTIRCDPGVATLPYFMRHGGDVCRTKALPGL